MMRILITGATGMLGSAVLQEFSGHYECIGSSRVRPAGNRLWLKADLTASDGWVRDLDALAPEVIIHTAALTDVDACERNPELAKLINTDSTRALATYCGSHGIHLVYISTDAVFDGLKSGRYTEVDDVHPLNVYARSKLAGEASVLDCGNSLVLRTNIFG